LLVEPDGRRPILAVKSSGDLLHFLCGARVCVSGSPTVTFRAWTVPSCMRSTPARTCRAWTVLWSSTSCTSASPTRN
jgi:hypothetical protein